MSNSIDDGARYFTSLSIKLERGRGAALRKSARTIKREAQRVLGTYDYGWPRLSEATIASKATGDSPGLETGEMRQSVHYSVDAAAGEAVVGSDSPKALWFELGTSRQPPRPWLMGAAVRKEAEVHRICGEELFDWTFSSKDTPDDGDYESGED